MQKTKNANKKGHIAAAHRQAIAEAAERCFREKGFERTTIEDVSRTSGYSRRTIYAYYESKEALLCAAAANGLARLKTEAEQALFPEGKSDGQADAKDESGRFFERFRSYCLAVKTYRRNYAFSSRAVVAAKTNANGTDAPEKGNACTAVFTIGEELTKLLVDFLEEGCAKRIISPFVSPLGMSFILSGQIEGLVSLTESKGGYVAAAAKMSEDEFFEAGIKQIFRSIFPYGESAKTNHI